MAGAPFTEKTTPGFWGFGAGGLFGEDSQFPNEKWQEPPTTKNHTGPGGFWAGSVGETTGSRNEKWQGPPKAKYKKGKKGKNKKGRAH